MCAAEKHDMADLFSPLPLGDTTARNRVMVAPMCQYSCDRDGLATDWHLVHLGSRAVGGAGIVMSEAAAVEPRGRITPRDLGIWSDEHATALESVTAFISEHGALPGIQLAHAGRKASHARPADGSHPLGEDDGGWITVGPTDTPYPRDETPPATRRLSTTEVTATVEAFREAAARAAAAGFRVAEIHAAHGYLIHQFLSPVTNNRTDQYGGDFESRVRFLREITRAVRSVWPADDPVFVRLSATDWLPDRDSWTVEQTTRLAPQLLADGADLIDVSAGGIHPDQQIPATGPNYLIPYAEAVSEVVGTEGLVGGVGKITTGEQADALVRNDRIDLAILGREHLRDPYFTLHAAQALDRTSEVEWPVQYQRAVR